MEEKIVAFETKYLVQENYSPKTRDAYMRYVREFVDFLGKRRITRDLLLEYRDRLGLKKDSPKTKNLKISSVRSFLDFLGKRYDSEILVSRTVLTTFQDRAGKKQALLLPSDDDVHDFFDNLEHDYENHAFYVIARLIAATGLRIAEVMNLKVGQVERKIVLLGKGAKQRFVLCDEDTVALVKEYEKALSDDARLLFPYAIRHVQAVFSEASGGTITPHTLRHIYATKRVEAGMSLIAVQKLLGHSSVQTTQRYLHIADDFVEAEEARVADRVLR